MTEMTFLVCTNYRLSEQNPSCAARGSELVIAKLRELGANVQASCCFGHCVKGAVVRAIPAGKFYYGVTQDDISTIIEQNKME
jgi:NADH:ubiquinone oxidoreductase subunit E